MCLMQFLYAEAWGGKKFLECKDCPIKCPNYEPKDEPQTQLTAKCIECNNSKACKENHWEGCKYEPLGYEVTAVVGTIKDEPQTERSE